MSGRRRSCGVGLQLRSEFHTKARMFRTGDQRFVLLCLCPSVYSVRPSPHSVPVDKPTPGERMKEQQKAAESAL